jgi:phosphoglycerate kinase
MHSVREAQLTNQRVILWSDLDVPVDEARVVENLRLKVSSKTINYLREQQAKVLIIGHLGRPEGKDKNFSLTPVKEELERLLGKKIEFLSELAQPQSQLTLLENIRFWPEEENQVENFAQKVADLGDIFVNDCFSTAHHAGSTMKFLPKLLPAYAGLALEKETHELAEIMERPKRPLVAILAGAKLETKLPAIKNMSKIADKVLVGGKLMFEFKESIPNVAVAVDNNHGFDIGPKTIELFKKELIGAATIVWNGTMGKYEEKPYDNGTNELAKAVVASGAYTLVGGGDTSAALDKIGLLHKINHVSMAGGAMLEFLAGEKLAGLDALGYYD